MFSLQIIRHGHNGDRWHSKNWLRGVNGRTLKKRHRFYILFCLSLWSDRSVGSDRSRWLPIDQIPSLDIVYHLHPTYIHTKKYFYSRKTFTSPITGFFSSRVSVEIFIAYAVFQLKLPVTYLNRFKVLDYVRSIILLVYFNSPLCLVRFY